MNGKTVPFIVRVETGTIDRAVYQTAALYDGQSPSPLRPDTSWNGKLVYTFGGGCDAGFTRAPRPGACSTACTWARATPWPRRP